MNSTSYCISFTFLLVNLCIVSRINFRQRNYAEVTTQLHGAISVVEEFAKYQSIPQIKQLTDRWVWPNRSHDYLNELIIVMSYQ